MHCESRLFCVLIGTSFLGACTMLRVTDTATVAVEPSAVAAKRVEVAASEPVAHSKPGPRTAVIVSADIPAFEEIVSEILRRGTDRVTVLPVPEEAGATARVISALETAKPDQIIAVGLPAAIAAHDFAKAPTVFCEVYNYQDHDLVSERSKGVYLLPPFALQLEAWRRLAHSPERIGVVSGPGQDALLEEMRLAAESFGIELSTRIARTDREALHAFRELAPDIEGFWLLPDNRILSPDAVREILAYSAEHDKQVATFGENLLKMGALLSSTGDPRDVVERVFARLENVDATGRLLGPDMLPLTAVRTRINYDVAKRMGLMELESTTDGR